MALSADHDIGGTALPVEIFPDAGGKFIGHPRTQRVADIDVFACDLYLHGPMNAPDVIRCQAGPIADITSCAPRLMTAAASTRKLPESATSR